MKLSLSSSSLLLGSMLKSDSEFDLFSKSFSKNVLFALAFNMSDSWSLLALEVLSPLSLKVAKAAKKSEDNLLSNTLIGELGLITPPIKKFF